MVTSRPRDPVRGAGARTRPAHAARTRRALALLLAVVMAGATGCFGAESDAPQRVGPPPRVPTPDWEYTADRPRFSPLDPTPHFWILDPPEDAFRLPLTNLGLWDGLTLNVTATLRGGGGTAFPLVALAPGGETVWSGTHGTHRFTYRTDADDANLTFWSRSPGDVIVVTDGTYYRGPHRNQDVPVDRSRHSADLPFHDPLDTQAVHAFTVNARDVAADVDVHGAGAFTVRDPNGREVARVATTQFLLTPTPGEWTVHASPGGSATVTVALTHVESP